MPQCFVFLLLASAAMAGDSNAEQGARKAMDKFMTTCNSRDAKLWAGSLNFPHVRLAGNAKPTSEST